MLICSDENISEFDMQYYTNTHKQTVKHTNLKQPFVIFVE